MLRALPWICCLTAAAPASATVLTIDDNGRVIVTPAPTRPIQPPAAPPQRSAVPASLAAPLTAAAARERLADELVAALAWVESRFRTEARSPAGAIGVMQLMPATARDLGVDPHEPHANLHGGAAYLRQMLDRYEGDLVRAIAAYNAGPGAVDRYRGLPPFPETRRYVAAVLAQLAASSLNGMEVTR